MSRLPFIFYEPLSTSTSGVSNDVPSRFPVALNGRPFMLDLASNAFRRESIPLLRTQADQSGRPGEASINPEDLWRRTATTWTGGAGQRYYDSDDTDPSPARFYKSLGIDPWTEGQISLLRDVDLKGAADLLAVAGTYLYGLTDTTLSYYTDVATAGTATPTDVTGLPGSGLTGITSDGDTVYVACGSGGIYTTTRGTASGSSFATGTVDGVKYVKGRLFAWAGDALYNIIGSGSLPTALLDHPNADFTWVDVAEGPGVYFMGGVSGDKSLIYTCAVKQDGTSLTTPVVAAQLPDGEILTALGGYLGFVLVGSNKGIRFGTSDQNGNVTLGGLIQTDNPVLCFEGQDRFVWFGWSDYIPPGSDEGDPASGLGRLDLSSFNGTRPAYATDVMWRDSASSGGDTTSVVTFQDQRVFCMGGSMYSPFTDQYVTSGFLQSGRINYGLYEPKVSMFVTASHDPLEGSLAMSLSTDGTTFTPIGATSSTPGEVRSTFPTAQTRSEFFELKITLTPNDDLDESPVVTRTTLRAYPVSARSEQITLPLIIAEHQEDLNGNAFTRDILDDIAFLDDLETAGALVTYQAGKVLRSVVVQDHMFIPDHFAKSKAGFEGTYIPTLKEFPEE